MARGSLGGVARAVLVSYTGTNPSASAVVIKKAGTNTNDTVGAAEVLVIKNFEFVTETGGACSVVGGTGRTILKGTIGAAGGGIANSNLNRRCQLATPPTVTAAAGGQVDFIAEGEIVKGQA